MNEDQIRSFLENYAKALSSGDLKRIAECWGTPSLVLSDDGAIPVSETEEVEKFFSQAVGRYRSQGLVEIRLHDMRVEILSEKLAGVNVMWDALDQAGDVQSTERSYYIVHHGGNGNLHIHVALSDNKST